MININRRKRQATENTEAIIVDVWNKIRDGEVLIEKGCEIHNIVELDQLISEIEPNVELLARSIQSDWAIPIVLQAVGEIYYGGYKEYGEIGNCYKRVLVYLWQNSYEVTGDYKNIERLKQLIKLSFVVEVLYSYRKMFVSIPELYFSFENGYTMVPEKFRESFLLFKNLAEGKGKRMRVAEVNSQLMNEKCIQFFEGMVGVLEGREPKDIDVFKETFYEEIPGVKNPECAKFWKELFMRYSFYMITLISTKELGKLEEVILFHEFAFPFSEKYITQESVQNCFWTKDWFKKQSAERYGNLIVAKPILRISPNGDFATSSAVIGDSINYFVESQLLGYSNRSPYLNLPNTIFKKAFSDKFENQCIEFFRSRGYLAGHVLENGIWKIQKENKNLSLLDEKLYGEVDVLAYHSLIPTVFLIECKVLHDVRDSQSYQNVIVKLKEDSEGFKSKLRKKAEWVKKAFEANLSITVDVIKVLVTDIPLPVLGANEEDILVLDYDTLKLMVENFDQEAAERLEQYIGSI